MSMSIKDALSSSSNGKVLVDEAKVYRQDIADRVRQIKDLAHEAFQSLHYALATGRVPGTKDTLKILAIQGGPAYEEAINALKFAGTDRQAYRTALVACGIEILPIR